MTSRIRIAAIALTASLMLSVAACGGANTNQTTAASAATTAAETTAATTAAETTAAPPAETTAAAATTAATTAAETTAAAARPFEGRELKLAAFEGGFGAAYWNAIIPQFEEATGASVALQSSPTIGDVVRPQIAAGNPPDMLLQLNDNDQTGVVLALIQDKGLLDITDVFDGPQYDSAAPLRDKIIDGVLDSAKCSPYGDGKIYLAPLNAGPMGLVYNKTLFEQNGWDVPVTWDEFFALGDKAKEQGIALFTYQGIYPGYLESVLFPAIASVAGTDGLKKITTYQEGAFNNPEVLAVLENFKKIADGGYLMEGTVALNHTQSQTDQMNNKALFIPNGTWMEEEMKDAPRAEGYAFALAPPPVAQAGSTRYIMSSLEQMSIPANAANPDAAKEFLRFLYTDGSIKDYAQACTAVMATKGAPQLVKDLIPATIYNMFEAYDMPGAAAVFVGFDALPQGSRIASANDEIFNPISDVMTGKMTAQEWADSIEQAYAQIRKDRG
jgi:N-acetylglucosamine transport system substrate-binding protein